MNLKQFNDGFDRRYGVETINESCSKSNKFDKVNKKKLSESVELKKKKLNEDSYGWSVDPLHIQDAYEEACEYFGEDDLNAQIVRCMSQDELKDCLDFIFRMNDFTESSYLEEGCANKSASLDEAVPKDLINSIKHQPGNYNRYGNARNDFNTGYGGIKNSWNPSTRQYDKPVTGVIDYENSEYDEVSPDFVLSLAKNGMDLSDVYIMKNGRHIRLDSEGHPHDAKSSINGLRANQSLKKSLEDADKVYIAKEKDLIDSQPEKAKARFSNEDERRANLRMGHDRDISKRDKEDTDTYLSAKGMSKEAQKVINDAKKAFDDGDISRKEMERRINSVYSRNLSPKDWAVRDYNNTRNRKANDRYVASNNKLKEPMDQFQELKYAIEDGESNLKRYQDKLDSLQKSGADSEQYAYTRKRIGEIKRQIASLQSELSHYENNVSDSSIGKDIEDAQRDVNDTSAGLEANKAAFNKLMRR